MKQLLPHLPHPLSQFALRDILSEPVLSGTRLQCVGGCIEVLPPPELPQLSQLDSAGAWIDARETAREALDVEDGIPARRQEVVVLV